MRKLNERGFTVVELLTSFSLAAVVMILLFNILVAIKESYINDKTTTEAISEQSLLTHALNEDALNCEATNVRKSDNEINISFVASSNCTGGNKKIEINNDRVTYAGEVYDFNDAISIETNSVSISTKNLSGINLQILKIPIIIHSYVTGEDKSSSIVVVYTLPSNP